MITQNDRVLVIDDDPDMGAVIANTAANLGMGCITTETAADFFEALTSDVTLIVLDLVMPNTDGIEILRLLGQHGCQAGIIVISGLGKRVVQTAEEVAGKLGLSIVGHLTKPFSVGHLQDMLLRSPKRSASQAPENTFTYSSAMLTLHELSKMENSFSITNLKSTS